MGRAAAPDDSQAPAVAGIEGGAGASTVASADEGARVGEEEDAASPPTPARADASTATLADDAGSPPLAEPAGDARARAG